MMAPNKKYLSLEEAAAQLGIKTDELIRLREKETYVVLPTGGPGSSKPTTSTSIIVVTSRIPTPTWI